MLKVKSFTRGGENGATDDTIDAFCAEHNVVSINETPYVCASAYVYVSIVYDEPEDYVTIRLPRDSYKLLMNVLSSATNEAHSLLPYTHGLIRAFNIANNMLAGHDKEVNE